MNLKAERGAATRERVLTIATRLFAERGYEDTSIETVLQESGLSRGALYHHYAGKEALFEAVLEATEAGVGARIVQAVRGPGARRRRCASASAPGSGSPATPSSGASCSSTRPPCWAGSGGARWRSVTRSAC
ncbi:TetR/AcrR family transcriptional regulator [Nonomuraea rubra]|uniref:TetR/AcrR family transcriptional regulator n=1 Tax=Nonomuraea rubra TaxID=46180 RepID=UPI003616BC3C